MTGALFDNISNILGFLLHFISQQQKLAEEDQKSKWLTRQEEILRNQKDELQQQINALDKKKVWLDICLTKSLL